MGRGLEAGSRADFRVGLTVNRPPNRVAFIHPDLGIGGAERLVVDAAVHLRRAGHRVVLFTASHDPNRCFQETTDGSIEVRVYGEFLPMQLGGHLRVPCAIARTGYVAGRMRAGKEKFEIIFCDLVPHIIPILRLFTGAKILFYCHYPDQLIAPQRRGWYRWYRAPIDRLEQITTGMADRILVNSQYTAAAFRRTFPRLKGRPLEVVYPGVDVDLYNTAAQSNCHAATGEITILSIGRYEPAKNTVLAIEAVAELRPCVPPEVFERIRLVIAGGFDERLAECRGTLADLQASTRRHRLEPQVRLLKSLPKEKILELLAHCWCVVHTAPREHFGYVPLEAMAAGRPVVVANTGGPAETVVDGATGFVRPPTPYEFASALAQLIRDPAAARRMGQAGRDHVRAHFSRAAFGARLEHVIEQEMNAGNTGILRQA
jgi:alpha-1,3/alpha-1,6-mannosyltransferase